jgi:hypothetical protein
MSGSLEALRPEHRESEVDEDGDRDREQDALDGGHTRSSAQTSPSMTAAKMNTLTITRRSPTGPLCRRGRQERVKYWRQTINKLSTGPRPGAGRRRGAAVAAFSFGARAFSYAGAVSRRVTPGRFPVAGSRASSAPGRLRRAPWLPALVAVLGLAVTACGRPGGSAGYGPYPVSLPGASTLCPTLAEVDYYVPVPTTAAAGIVERSTTVGVRSTVRCVYGNPARKPRHAASIEIVLRPSASQTRPRGVVLSRIRGLGVWMVSYHQGGLNSVVVHQGGIDVIVTSAVPVSDLVGFAEEELARVPAPDRVTWNRSVA